LQYCTPDATTWRLFSPYFKLMHAALLKLHGVLPQVLIRRWGILWRPLEVRFDKRAALIGCCMRLHNYCIDHRISEEDLRAMNGEEAIPVPGDNPNSDPLGSRSRDSDIEEFDEPLPHPEPMARSVTRDNLIEEVNKSGITRPSQSYRSRRLS